MSSDDVQSGMRRQGAACWHLPPPLTAAPPPRCSLPCRRAGDLLQDLQRRLCVHGVLQRGAQDLLGLLHEGAGAPAGVRDRACRSATPAGTVEHPKQQCRPPQPRSPLSQSCLQGTNQTRITSWLDGIFGRKEAAVEQQQLEQQQRGSGSKPQEQ